MFLKHRVYKIKIKIPLLKSKNYCHLRVSKKVKKVPKMMVLKELTRKYLKRILFFKTVRQLVKMLLLNHISKEHLLNHKKKQIRN